MDTRRGACPRASKPMPLLAAMVLAWCLATAAVAFAVLGEPLASMSINGGAVSTNSTTVSIDSNVSDAVYMSTSSTFRQIDGGYYVTWGIAADGSLWRWGLIAGTPVATPVRVVTADRWASVSCGSSKALLVRDDGTLWSCSDQGVPVQISSSSFKAVAAGGGHFLALTTGGTLYGWGENSYGQVGDSSVSYVPSPVAIGSGYSAISAGDYHSAAVKAGGDLYTWGDGSKGQLARSTGVPWAPGFAGSGFTTPTCGAGTTFVLDGAGGLWAAGDGYFGQLGVGSRLSTDVLVPTLGTGWAQVAAGQDHVVARRADGSLWAWGGGGYGQNGLGTGADALEPTRIGSRSDWSHIAVSGYGGYGIRSSAGFSWGYGPWGALGDGTLANRPTPSHMDVWAPYAEHKTVDIGAGDGERTVIVKYRDSAEGLLALTDSIVVDSTGPSGWVWVNADRTYTESRDVTLTIGCAAGDAVAMRVGTGEWVPFASIATATLSPGDGYRTVSVDMRDEAGNVGTASDGIYLDTVAPSGSMSLNGGAAVTRYPDVGVSSNVSGASWIMAQTGVWSSISADRHTMLLTSDGRLYGWGVNGSGQIGTGSFVSADHPTPVAGSMRFSAVAAGYDHTLAIRDDGTLWAWGGNAAGQLGDGTKVGRPWPTLIAGDSTWTAVSAGSYYSLAIRSDGTLWAWGSNDSGRLGIGSASQGEFTSPTQVGSDHDWMAVDAAEYNAFGIRAEGGGAAGTLWGWGSDHGYLGDGTNTSSFISPVQLGAEAGWTSVSAADSGVLALKADGTLWGWGRNLGGCLGIGVADPRSVPTQVGADTDWDMAVVGSVARKTDGSLWSWGPVSLGQGADAFYRQSNAPVRVPAPDCRDITATGLLVTAGGDLYSAGPGVGADTMSTRNVYQPAGFVAYAPEVSFPIADTPGPVTVRVVYKDAAGNQLELTDSIVYDPGAATSMTLNGGAAVAASTDLTVNASVPDAVAMRIGSKWQGVHAGEDYTMIHMEDGPVLFAGSGQFAQGGNGDLPTYTTSFTAGGKGRVWMDYSAGGHHSLALAPDGTLWAWGYNPAGQLGVPSLEYAAEPVIVTPEAKYRAVFAGLEQSFAIREDGTLWAWGSNAGVLGDGTTTTRRAPVRIGDDADWAKITCWGSQTLALKTDGSLWAWGQNGSGQLGLGDTVTRLAPAPVAAGTRWLDVSANYLHSAGLQADGSLWTWGANNHGQLGDGTSTSRTLPVRIGTGTWNTVATGIYCSFGIRSDGTLWSWGDNGSGQLGDGTYVSRNAPAQVGTRTDWEHVDSGGSPDGTQVDRYHTVATTTDGHVFTWGYNGCGQLGKGNAWGGESSPVDIPLSAFVPYAAESAVSVPWASGETTVNVCFRDAAGHMTWLSDSIFVTPEPPVVSGVSPVPGSVAETATPEISAKVAVAPGGTPALFEVRVDGMLIPSNYDASTSRVTAPTTGLSDDTSHTVEIRVLDAGGNDVTVTSRFLIEAGPGMPHWDAEASCLSCHGSTHGEFPVLRDVGAQCTLCHSQMHPHKEYSCMCHPVASQPHVMTNCRTCHTRFDAGSEPVRSETPGHITDASGCKPCHRSELRFEHALRTTDAGASLDCATCHSSADPGVAGAIAAGDTGCPACHGQVDHRSSHASVLEPSCQECHSENLWDEHVQAHGRTCATCHQSGQTKVTAAIAAKRTGCLECHGAHPHRDASIAGVKANGERLCTDCHSASLLVEHSKPSSSSAGNGCPACHVPGGARSQIGGDWDGTCDTPACHGPASGRAMHTTYCTGCHSSSSTEFASTTVDFSVSRAVDRSVACIKCHWEPTGAHPFHNASMSCTVCHVEMGVPDGGSVPRISTAYGFYASVESTRTDADTLHVIHENPGWAANIVKKGRQCGSCHAAAACTVCHAGSVARTHRNHTWDDTVGAYWTGTQPASVSFAEGTVPGDEMVNTQVTGLTCSNTVCHGISSVAAAPVVTEDGRPTVVYTTTPAWSQGSQAGYSGGTYRISNVSSATATFTFTGQKVVLVSDRASTRGWARVSVDATNTRDFNLYSATTEKQYAAYTSPTLAAGTHTLTVRVLGIKGKSNGGSYVVVDAFRVYPKVGATLAKCSACHMPDTYTGAPVDRTGDHP